MTIVHTERVDGISVARIRDDVDAANAAGVHEQLSAALGPDTNCLIVDLSEARYLDSAGLDMLLRLTERLSHRRATLLLVIPADSQLYRLIEIAGLAQAVTVYSSLPAAQEACAALARSDAPAPEVSDQDNASRR
jgi:anti-sigma B factor antagonist